MFVGFIAVIVILLVIVGLMSTGVLSTGESGNYMTQVKKIQEALSIMKSESKFYYVKKDTFSGISAEYFKDIKFGNIVPTANPAMNSADWDGWPTGVDTPLPDPYSGPYMTVEGIGNDEIRIIPLSINDGKAVSIFILIKKNSTLPNSYKIMLEKVLSSDSSYIGG